MSRRVHVSMKWMVGLAAVVLSVMLLFSMKVDAGARMKKLKVNQTYTTVLTGKKKHKIRYTYSSVSANPYRSLRIYVDGKKVKTIKSYSYDWKVYLCKVSSKRALLYLRDVTDNYYHNYMKIMEYKNGKMRQLADLVKPVRNDKLFSNWARGDLISVSAGKLVVRWNDTGRSTGAYYVDVPYKVSGNKIIRQGSSYALKVPKAQRKYMTVNWTAKQSFLTYISPDGSRISFQVNRGEKVKGLRMAKRNGRTYFQIKNSKGQKGWLLDPESYGSSGYFKEAVFAG